MQDQENHSVNIFLKWEVEEPAYIICQMSEWNKIEGGNRMI